MKRMAWRRGDHQGGDGATPAEFFSFGIQSDSAPARLTGLV